MKRALHQLWIVILLLHGSNQLSASRETYLGMILYEWNNSALVKKWGTINIGQGSSALAWLTADIDGDGKQEIIQTWNNRFRYLGVIVYGWNGTALVTKWGTGNIGQGPGALAWLTADIDGDGKQELIQPWKNQSQLGVIVYGWNGTALVTKWATTNIGQGPGALAWLTADIDGDGKQEIIQPWKNQSRLGVIVYGWNGTALVSKWGTT
ncbi:VCBS repeat-containing protein, partial [candidate division KSB1 bacterium]|nr:VCBS repeat-containing protein [candidate division KSB1 bacterium]